MLDSKSWQNPNRNPGSLTCNPLENNGRDDRIRTCDLFTPSEARYQAALHPDLVCLNAGVEPGAV